MEICIGEYVRTKNGTIHKIEKRDTDGHLLIDTPYKGGRYFTFVEEKEDIVNHSKNIIDLIEVGDIVNNGYVYEIGNTEDGHKWVHNLNGLLLLENDIKTILTKEQYKRNCYTVEQ